MDTRPNVIIDPGLRLDDRTAGTLVDAMLDALEFDLDRIDQAAEINASNKIATLGSPKGQARFVKRFARMAGKALLGNPDITYGTRKRFSMYFDLFDVQRDVNGRRWMFLTQLGIQGEGVSKRIEKRSIPLLLMTHHSLVRLVQRAGARTPEHLLDIVRGALPLALLAAWASEGATRLPEGSRSGWLVPVARLDREMNDTADLSYMVLRKGSHEGETFDVPVVATVLDGSMIINHEALAPLMGMMALDGAVTDDTAAELWRLAFEATVKATRMGRRET